MKRIILSIAAAGAIAASAAPAFAQGPRASDWQPLSARQSMIERRIDQGVRSGQLTRRETMGLRGAFQDLLRLEARYERGGLNYNERVDLQRRYDGLSARVRLEKHDGESRYGDDRYHPAGRR
jgi:hypothetical protein